MTITKEDIYNKYAACVDNLDRNKLCINCKHFTVNENDYPCNECYELVLGFPVDPTKFEAASI